MEAQWAIGTLLKIGDGASPEVFTPIARVNAINGFGITADMIDTTSHDSPGGWGQQIPGVLRGNDITLDLNLLPDSPSHQMLITAIINREKHNFKITFPAPTAAEWELSGYISAIGGDAPFDGKLEGQATISPTGAMNFNPGSGGG